VVLTLRLLWNLDAFAIGSSDLDRGEVATGAQEDEQ
jgi:hypothetical protein